MRKKLRSFLVFILVICLLLPNVKALGEDQDDIPFNYATYMEVNYNGIKAVVTSFDYYYRISDINDISEMNFNYDIDQDLLTYDDDEGENSIDRPNYRILILYKDEYYISRSIIEEIFSTDVPDEISDNRVKEFEEANLPDGANYIDCMYNNVKIKAIRYNEKTYISQGDLMVNYQIFGDDLIENKIKFSEGTRSVVLDTQKNDSYIVVGLSQYFDIRTFKSLKQNKNNSLIQINEKNMKIKISSNNKLLEATCMIPSEIKDAKIIEINGHMINKVILVDRKLLCFDSNGYNPPKKNSKRFKKGEIITLKIIYTVFGITKPVSVRIKL